MPHPFCHQVAIVYKSPNQPLAGKLASYDDANKQLNRKTNMRPSSSQAVRARALLLSKYVPTTDYQSAQNRFIAAAADAIVSCLRIIFCLMSPALLAEINACARLRAAALLLHITINMAHLCDWRPATGTQRSYLFVFCSTRNAHSDRDALRRFDPAAHKVMSCDCNTIQKKSGIQNKSRAFAINSSDVFR